ncbi:hypothetical protein D9M73_279020 [compost metagenome]
MKNRGSISFRWAERRVDFNNPTVLQLAATYSTHRDAIAIAASADPSVRESGRCGGVRLGAVVRGRECIRGTGSAFSPVPG